MRILAIPFLFAATVTFAQVDPGFSDIRPLTMEFVSAIQKGDFEKMQSLQLQKPHIVTVQKELKAALGKGADEEINKILNEIGKLDMAWSEFNAGKEQELKAGWEYVVNFSKGKGIKWKDAKFLYDTYSIKKRGPFQFEASVTVVFNVNLPEDGWRKTGVTYRAIQVGGEWVLMGGIGPDSSYESYNDQENTEAAEEMEADDY